VTNIAFIFETSLHTKPKEKKWGDMAYYIPPPEKVGDTRPRVSHQIAPMTRSKDIQIFIDRTFRAGVPNLLFPMHPVSISTCEHVPLQHFDR